MTKQTNVLIVEDEESWQFELRLPLEQEGYKVTVIDNAEDAKTELKKELHKILILDMSLIKGDAFDRLGLDVLKYVEEKNYHIPVIVVTGYIQPSEVMDLTGKGRVNWYFDKSKFYEERKHYLDEVKSSIKLSDTEKKARWKAIEKRLKSCD